MSTCTLLGRQIYLSIYLSTSADIVLRSTDIVFPSADTGLESADTGLESADTGLKPGNFRT